MNKLRKAVMTWTRLLNKYRKGNSARDLFSYERQGNICVKLLDKVISEEKNVVKKFKDHVKKIVETLKIDRPILSDLSDDPVVNAIENFPHHVFLKSRKWETLLIAFLLN